LAKPYEAGRSDRAQVLHRVMVADVDDPRLHDGYPRLPADPGCDFGAPHRGGLFAGRLCAG
jgi:hypothetical protein